MSENSNNSPLPCIICGLPCNEHRNDERHAPTPPEQELRVSVLNPQCPRCARVMVHDLEAQDIVYCECSPRLGYVIPRLSCQVVQRLEAG